MLLMHEAAAHEPTVFTLGHMASSSTRLCICHVALNPSRHGRTPIEWHGRLRVEFPLAKRRPGIASVRRDLPCNHSPHQIAAEPSVSGRHAPQALCQQPPVKTYESHARQIFRDPPKITTSLALMQVRFICLSSMTWAASASSQQRLECNSNKNFARPTNPGQEHGLHHIKRRISLCRLPLPL